MMMRRGVKNRSGRNIESATSGEGEEVEWEMRPGGMLVQKRASNSEASVSKFRVRVSYCALRYEISVYSRATFGELKKLLAVETGLQAGEQKITFRGKERGNEEYLDLCGVRDRSNVVMMEDPRSVERRIIETRRNAKIRAVHRLIDDVTLEVDKLESQVFAIEKAVASGNKVVEVQITTLIEMLMRQAVKLDSIAAEGDASAQRNLQGERVRKCVENLDVLKMISNKKVKPVTVTTSWETFDPHPASTHWELFD